jgi:large subunit ribosomal protein L9
MATTKVILREKITGLGAEADVVKVKAGFARNFLIPNGKALEATKGNLRTLESLHAKRAQRETEELADAQELAGKISRIKPKFTLETGQGGKAFGSITSMDIQKELEAKGIIIDRTAIKLDKPLKRSGKSDVEVRVHSEVTTSLTVTVETAEGSAPASPSGESDS